MRLAIHLTRGWRCDMILKRAKHLGWCPQQPIRLPVDRGGGSSAESRWRFAGGLFDAAARAGIPLTLGGHTHGGQIMLNSELGAGPLMYRYWSGLYRKPTGQAAVISNGAGNWFPLRTAAPAEILHLTLKRA